MRFSGADNHRLGNKRILFQEVFQPLRGDFLASRAHDQIFPTVRHPQKAFAIRRADIAGVQPARGVDRFLTRDQIAEAVEHLVLVAFSLRAEHRSQTVWRRR